MFDLKALPGRYLDQLGKDRVAEIAGVSPSVVAMWVARGAFPLDAVQKLLESDPTPLHEIRPLYPVPDLTRKLSIIVPSALPISLKTTKCLTKMLDKDMEFEPESFNSLYHVRNMAAARFLKSNREWSFWSDGDMLHPCGDAEWYKKAIRRPHFPDVFAGLNTIYRLLSHKKTIVSVVYIEKRTMVRSWYSRVEMNPRVAR